MAQSGQEGNIPPTPVYTDKLETLLRSKTIRFNSNWWRDINTQTRNFYISKNMNLSTKIEYGTVCKLIQQKFPKIPLDLFRKKLSQNFRDYRKNLENHTREVLNNKIPSKEVSSNAELVVADKREDAETTDGNATAEKSNHPIQHEIHQVLALSTAVDLDKLNEFQLPVEKINSSVLHHRHVELPTEPSNSIEEVTHEGVHPSVDTTEDLTTQSFKKMSTPRSSAVKSMGTIWNISHINTSMNVQLEPLRNQPQFFQSGSVSTTDQAPSSIEPGDNSLDVPIRMEEIISECLIDLQHETASEAESQTDLTLYFTKVSKCENRPAPTNMRIGINSYKEFAQKLLMEPNNCNYTEDTMKTFEDLFDHRTLTLWNCTEETFQTMYSCLNGHQMMDCEVKLLYGEASYDAMKYNLDSLLRAIHKMYSYLNIASAVNNFILSINPTSEYITLFRDEGRFERYVEQPVPTHSICVLLSNEVIFKITEVSPQFTINHKGFSEALFLSVLQFHVLEKSFPCTQRAELKFFEDFILGSTPLDISGKARDLLTSALTELSTL